MVCVIIWLSQPRHELYGPGSSTEAGFVQAFCSPSVISSHNCMRSHKRRTDEKETAGVKGDAENDERDQIR